MQNWWDKPLEEMNSSQLQTVSVWLKLMIDPDLSRDLWKKMRVQEPQQSFIERYKKIPNRSLRKVEELIPKRKIEEKNKSNKQENVEEMIIRSMIERILVEAMRGPEKLFK
jgi:hypothetical protein